MPIQDDRHHPFLEKMSTLLNPSPHHKPHHSPSSTKKLSHVSHFRKAFHHLPFQPRSFDLGDIASPQDMIIESNTFKALGHLDLIAQIAPCCFEKLREGGREGGRSGPNLTQEL